MLLKDFVPKLNKKYNDIFFSGISFDSSKIKKNNIFFAIKGNKFDGNNFINEAFKNGAILAITDSKKIDIRQNIIKVEDLNDAAAKVCSNFYNFPQKKI